VREDLAMAANFCSAVGLELHTRFHRAASQPTSQGAGVQRARAHQGNARRLVVCQV